MLNLEDLKELKIVSTYMRQIIILNLLNKMILKNQVKMKKIILIRKYLQET